MDANPLSRFTVLVGSGSDSLTVDGVEHDGKLWLVPRWDQMSDGTIRPQRMIRFDDRKYQKGGGATGHDYTLNRPIARAVLDGALERGYEILKGDAVPSYVAPPKAH